ncbi:MAG: hypothetical protein WCL18_04015 [bacterium]
MKRNFAIFDLLVSLLFSLAAAVMSIMNVVTDLSLLMKQLTSVLVVASTIWMLVHVIYLLTRMSKSKYEFDQIVKAMSGALFSTSRNRFYNAKEHIERLSNWIIEQKRCFIS